MTLSTYLTAFLAVTPALAETIHGVVVFTRHGDRTAKFYPGYQMTNLGATQVYSSGQFYRQRYVQQDAPNRIASIEPDKVDYRQVWASAPDQAVLYQTATNFLQGLYPPLDLIDQQLTSEILANGSTTSDPLNGYQFILVHGEGDTDPDTIWIKGDDACPAYSAASKSYSQSSEYKTVMNDTTPFYSRFTDLVGPIMGAENVTYKNAYDVFDLLNVASIHNSSVAPEIAPEDLDRLRYLANEWEWNHNFNATQPDRSIGGMTLAGGLLRRLEAVVDAGARKNKFQLMAGSYDTFLAFFGVTNLVDASSDFLGLPNYAATMALEVFSDDGDVGSPAEFPGEDGLRVRWLFRNGTDATEELTAWPLFGGSEVTLPYSVFVDEMNSRAITSLGQWCGMCGSTEDFCVAANETSSATPSSASVSATGSGLSNAAAGGIGAGVTLAVVAVVAGLVWLMMKKRKTEPVPVERPAEKRASDSGSDLV